jgi:hypothetical protein
MSLPTLVQAVVDDYLEITGAEAPGLVEGLYLVGSVALGEFRPASSDIDFVAVTANRPDAVALAALERVHTRHYARWRRPFFDGIYVTWNDLAGDPARLGPGPSTHESRFHTDSRGERNPIVWHTLAQCGVCCYGPATAALAVWHDPAVLAAWTNNNLDSYWRRFIDRGANLFTPSGLAALSAWSCMWCVLGVSRLHYTLATSEITSKEGAGLYAFATFPARWRRVNEEALRIRRVTAGRSRYGSPLARRRDVLDFTNMVIEDSHRVYVARWS